MPRVNEVAWTEIEADKNRLQPTPPVGEKIVWYMAGVKENPVAAQVTEIESAGRIKLVVFPKNTFPQHKAGVYHVSAKIHDKPGNPTTRNCGAWDYVRGEAPDEDYSLHRAEIEKREQNLLVGERQAAESAQLFEKKQAEKASGKKKPLPDPLDTVRF